MAIRWKDFKQKSSEIVNEFKQHRVGIVGLGIIITLLLVGIFAPVLAPNTNENWSDSMEWRDNPRKAPPVWWDYFTSEKMAHHKIQTEPYEVTDEEHQVGDLADAGLEYTNITYKYNNEADLPPKDLITYLDGSYDNSFELDLGYGQTETVSYKPKLEMSVERPDGKTIDLLSKRATSNDTFGPGEEPLRYSFIKSRESKENIYNFGRRYYEPHTYDEGDLTLNLNRTWDGSGNYLPEDSHSWTTLDEKLGVTGHTEGAPEIVSAYPGDGVEGFNVNHDLQIEFSEEIDTFGYGLTNTDTGDTIDVNTTWNWDNSAVTLSPENLSFDQQYELRISDATDVDGNNGADDPFSFVFTTQEQGVNDTIDPEITSVYPEPGTDMKKDQDITITFSEPVKKDTFDFNYSQNGDTTTDGVHATWSNNRTVVKIAHDSPVPDMVNVKSAQVVFGKANGDILSLNPDPLKGDYYFHINITGVNLDVDFGGDASHFIYAGRVYGWMGTDHQGRDIAMAWVWGARYALLLGAVVALTTVAIGTAYGMTSAYFGGWVDEIMQRGNEVVIGIPLLPMLIILMFIWRQSFWVMILLMCLLYWRGIAKTIRARGLQIKQSTFVEAAESLGAGGGRIISTHMIPQILPYSVAEAALIVPGVIVAEASLSVLGLGDPSIVTWGKLLSSANEQSATVQGLWWWVMLPGLGITIVGFSFIATGMAIEKVVQPKMKQR